MPHDIKRGIETHRISVSTGALRGDLAVPDEARGVIVFAHGHGSDRHSPRNRRVADLLRRAGYATLLLDLAPEGDGLADFDLEFFSRRFQDATQWLLDRPESAALPIGYFGGSTGAAVALAAAAEMGSAVGAIVSRGGRPMLAAHVFDRVKAPTLFLLGEMDDLVVIENRKAYDLFPGEKAFTVVPGASHVFKEPGKLERVAQLATGWYRRHLGGPA